MLSGQEIGLTEVLGITMFGMSIALLVMFMMILAIIILGKVVPMFDKSAAKTTATSATTPTVATPAPVPAPAPAPVAMPAPVHGASEEEIAAISAAISLTIGAQPHEFRIVSISTATN